MNQIQKMIIATILRNIARYFLLILGILVFIFALLSGAEGYGGGFEGVIKNSPNALPWLILLILVYVAWRWELLGGIIITLLGLSMVYYFNFNGSNFFISTFILTLLITLLGYLFIISWWLRRKYE